jgi:small subunit ribosomal protein S1
VHISELANHHVENPREVVQPGDEVRVKILEIDSERRRLSLSVKRVEGQELPRRSLEGAGDLDHVPSLGLSEDVFAGGDQDVPAQYADYATEAPLTSDADEAPAPVDEATAPADEAVAQDAAAPEAEVAPEAEAEVAPEAEAEVAPEAEAEVASEPEAEPAPEPEAEAEAAPEAEAPADDEEPQA